MRSFLWCVVAISGLAFVSDVIAEEKAVPLDKLPKSVTEAVKKMFPNAKMLEASMEEEGGEIEYEVAIKENGKKIDVTVEADGEIEGLEKEIDLKDVPKAVIAALETKYPMAVFKSAEAVFEIEDGKEELEFYEIQIKTADSKEIEVMMKADGSIVTKQNKENNADEKAVPIEKLPKAVTESIEKMFPKAKLFQATVEKEDGEIKYEVTIKENGKKIDVTVEADGEIEGMEKEIDLKDLPKAVIAALETKYPKAVLKSAEAVFEIEDGKEELEFYEIQIKTADSQEIEVMMKADGSIVTKADKENVNEKAESK